MKNLSCLRCRKELIRPSKLPPQHHACRTRDEERLWSYRRGIIDHTKDYPSAPRRRDRTGHAIECLLSEEDILTLLDEAGITIWDIGIHADDYCLARNNDLGDYVMGNVRFITQRENYNEAWGFLSPEEQEEWRIRGTQDGYKSLL